MNENRPLPAANSGSNQSVPYLDGVRGLAILLVALGHLFYDYYIFKIGWVGLNLFFVLSGFLITQRLFHFKEQSIVNYFRNFYARRFLRIFPLYYVVLIFFLIFLPGLSTRFQNYFSELTTIQWSYWLYTSNWNIISNGLPEQSLFFHFWSLAVEEQFYLVWPILFLIFYNARCHYILIFGLIFVSMLMRVNTAESLHAYVSTVTAAEPLLLGSLLSIVYQNGILKKVASWMLLGVILSISALVLIFWQNNDLHITNAPLMKYGYSAINIIMTFLICYLLLGGGIGLKFRRFFTMKWLRWLGKYSYGIYIFHWIILQTVIFKLNYLMLDARFDDMAAYLLARAAGILIILVISYFSYQLFERYFIGLKKYFTQDFDWKWPSIGFPLLQKGKGKFARNEG